MNATTTSGRKRTRAATDRAETDVNTVRILHTVVPPPRQRVSDAYPEMPASRHHHHHHHQQQPQQQQQQQHVPVVTSTAAVVQATQQSVKEKQRLCTNCKNHGLRKVWKKHKRYCKYRDCPCLKCMKTAATRKNCAEQTAKRRARQEDEQREQELQLNPSNFLDERPIPYQPEATAPQSCNRRNMSESSQVARSSTPKGTMSPRTSDFDDHDSSSIDIVNGRDGIHGDCMIVERDDSVDDRSSHLMDDVDKKDIDADSRPRIMSNKIEHVKSILKELVGRTKDFQNLNAFRLFVLQHNTYDVDKATMLIKRAHEELKFLDMITEKSEANATAAGAMPSAETKMVVVLPAHQQQVHHGRQSVNRPPTSALIGHHHQPPPPPPPLHHQTVVQQLNQQPPLHHTRSGSNLSVTADYRGAAVEPPTAPPVIVLEPGAGGGGGGGGGGGRRATVNGNVSGGGGVICGGAHQPHAAVWHPRPIYPFPLPLPSPGALWHHAQPHFSTPGFPPFIENEWSRHCRLPMFNPELQPEPVNLQNNNHHQRRPEPGRALEIAGRLQQERAAHHNRPAAANPPAQDDREQTRHHA